MLIIDNINDYITSIMEIRQLRYFVTSAELLNFTEAAEACYVTQGTLSQQLKQLETELGVLLFDRIGKCVYLTDAGNLFLPYARQTIAESEGGRQILEDFKELKTGEIRIGTTYALTNRLGSAIIAFTERYPQINILVTFGTSEELMAKLANAELDFVLAFGAGGAKDHFQSYPLFESRLALIMSNTHDLADKDYITISQIKDVPLALPAKGFNTRTFIDSIFTKEHLAPTIKIELNDIPTLLNLIKTGRWCTILTLASVADQKGLTAVPFRGKHMTRTACISWPKNIYRKKAAVILAELMANK